VSSVAPGIELSPLSAAGPSGRARRIVRNLARDPTGLAGAVGVLIFTIVAIFGPWLTPHGPYSTDVLHLTQGPTWAHPFGTDELGRDVFSRVIIGTRASMLAGFLSTAIGAAIGTALGVVSGYAGGWLDEGLMRILDIILAFPQVVLAIALAATLGPSLANVIGIIAFLFIPQFARVARGSVLVIKEMDYITASRIVGVGRARILLDHVLPNAFGPILVLISLSIPSAILTEAALSFLGVGIQPPAPSWGNLIADGSNNLLIDPWIAVFPGLTITVAVLAFNCLGDGLRDIFDPRGLRK
jgi:peptide/nickel transport system permease protein